jgi:hypothetical protein
MRCSLAPALSLTFWTAPGLAVLILLDGGKTAGVIQAVNKNSVGFREVQSSMV